ncbi:MAG TPA: hypothetical protein VJA66_09595 [Thermoanaerobaculia bacterium]
MSVLYLHFQNAERNGRVQKLAKSGAHIVVTEPRWPGFFELAKKEKPYAIAVDFSSAPSHALETADYLAKARETRDLPIYLLRVPVDRTDIVKKRLPQAPIVSEPELADILAEKEKEAQARALEKKEAAALARKNARAKKAATERQTAAAAAPAKAAAKPKKPVAPPTPPKKKGSPKKKPAVKKKPARKQSKKK